MPDIFTKKKRSAVMSLIRGSDNKAPSFSLRTRLQLTGRLMQFLPTNGIISRRQAFRRSLFELWPTRRLTGGLAAESSSRGRPDPAGKCGLTPLT